MARPSVIKDFVLSQPLDMPIKEVMRLGKKAGHSTISKSYISKVRVAETRRSKPARAVNGHAVDMATPADTPRNAPLKRTLSTPELKPVTETELQFRRLLVVVGTERAQAFIDAYREADEASLEA